MTVTYEELTERNAAFVTADEQSSLRSSAVFVCGVGGMGGAAAEALVRAGVGALALADHDRFEASNLNRQSFAFLDTLGMEKTRVTREALERINPELRIEVFDGDWVDRLDDLLVRYPVVVNGMDDVRATIRLYRKAREHGATVIDAYTSPYPSVTVVRPDDPRPEERLRFPTLGVPDDELTADQLQGAFLRELAHVSSVSSGIRRLDPRIVEDIVAGRRARSSFAPVVTIAGNLMAFEAIGQLLGRASGAGCEGYFMDLWGGRVERPRNGRPGGRSPVSQEPVRRQDRGVRLDMGTYGLQERSFSTFFQVPFEQYGSAQQYVSPFRADLARMLDGTRNPVFGDPDLITYFTVSKGGRPLGRITAHIHRASNERYGRDSGSFGFFDCADDPEAAGLLLDAAGSWLQRRGCDEMAGNFNLTAMQEMGVVVADHGRAPFLGQHHNPPWIPGLLEGNGFTPYFPMTTWRLGLADLDPDVILGPKQRALLERSDVTVEPIRRRDFRRSMEATWHLLNASFDENPHFVPLTHEEFFFQADQMLWLLDPRISYLARVDGEPVGVIACLPDINPLLRATGSRLRASAPIHYFRFRRRRRRASLIFGGVDPEMQNRGLAGVLLHAALGGMKRAGYRELGITWISETNKPSLRQMEKLGASPLHRLNLYRKAL